MGSRGDTKARVTKRGRVFVAAHALCPEGYTFTRDRWTNWVCPAAKCRLCGVRLFGVVRARYLQFNRAHYWTMPNYTRGPRRNDLTCVHHICEGCWAGD